MTNCLQQRWFRRVSTTARKASKKVELSRIGSWLCAFQRAIDEVRTLPLTPQKSGSKSQHSYISVTDEASNFKFGMQLRFAKTHHQIPPENWEWDWAREAPKIWGFPINISAMAEDSDFEFGIQLGFAKAHHKITPIEKSGHGLGLRELFKILWFHFSVYTMAEARDFKFGTWLWVCQGPP